MIMRHSLFLFHGKLRPVKPRIVLRQINTLDKKMSQKLGGVE